MHVPNKSHAALVFALAIASGAAIAGGSPAKYKGQELAAQAKVPLDKARQIALAAFKGRITDEELEHEPGGSGLRYTFDIREGKTTHEVGVDAVTGEVLENQKEAD